MLFCQLRSVAAYSDLQDKILHRLIKRDAMISPGNQNPEEETAGTKYNGNSNTMTVLN